MRQKGRSERCELWGYNQPWPWRWRKRAENHGVDVASSSWELPLINSQWGDKVIANDNNNNNNKKVGGRGISVLWLHFLSLNFDNNVNDLGSEPPDRNSPCQHLDSALWQRNGRAHQISEQVRLASFHWNIQSQLWKWTLGTATMENSMEISKKIKIWLSSSNCTSGYVTEGNKISISKVYLHTHIHYSIMHNIKHMDTM